MIMIDLFINEHPFCLKQKINHQNNQLQSSINEKYKQKELLLALNQIHVSKIIKLLTLFIIIVGQINLMSSVQNISKSDDYKQQKSVLNKNKLLDPKIQPTFVQGISNYRQFLIHRINIATLQLNYKATFFSKIKIVIEILNKEQKQKSLVYVVKKCGFLHLFLHLGCEAGLINSEDAELITKFINQLIKVDIPKLTQTENTNRNSRNSLQKLYNYIRGNSQPKQLDKSKSKLKMEQTNDKGAIKQLAYKVIVPLCSYFLKISQGYTVYQKILRRKISADQQEQIKWKMMNYLGLLSNIITELNRIGKYYKQDLTGCWVLLYYIMSTDVTIYVNLLAQSLGNLCQQWQQKIILVEKFAKISKNHRVQFNKILSDQKFMELVKQIEIFLDYKQKIIYLYFNSHLKPFLSYFRRPEAVTKKFIYTEVFEFILSLATKTHPQLSNKKTETIKDEKDFDNRKTGEVIKRRIHSQSNEILSPNSTIQSTIRDRIQIDKQLQQKAHVFSIKNKELSNNLRANNFISTVKSRAMGK